MSTFLSHPHAKAFLETTILTATSRFHVDGTGLVVESTRISYIATDASFKEALAAFATRHTVMTAGGAVPAHMAETVEITSAGNLSLIGLL